MALLNNHLILILTILPLTLFGQKLDCCTSINDVEINLNGYWKFNSQNKNEQLKFEFNDGVGKFWRYKINDNNEIIESKKLIKY